jgi:hypothetical protein
VRVLVKSDGANVPNVTARLTGRWGNDQSDTIQPMTTTITVKRDPGDTLVTSFLFALPFEWTHHDDLELTAILNPNRFPLEPTYADNTLTKGPYHFSPNPRGVFQIVQVGYHWAGTDRWANDLDSIVSWLYRAYPLGIEPGQTLAYTFPFYYRDLGSKIHNFANDPACKTLVPQLVLDDPSYCASEYLNFELARMRQLGQLPSDVYIYASFVSTPAGVKGPGGLASRSLGPVSSGPSLLAKGWSFAASGSMAGHELAHLLGRDHPASMADNPNTPGIQEGCGHSPDDPNFPYLGASIADVIHHNTGFDSGWGVPGGSPRLFRWFDNIKDVMSYCGTHDNEWLSPYTYGGIYDWLAAHPSPAVTVRTAQAQSVSGDLLQVGGIVTAGGAGGSFLQVERVDYVVEASPQEPGALALRLVAADGSQLASHPFSPSASDDSEEWLSFLEVVPFAGGTRTIQLINLASGAVLDSQLVSPAAPTVGNVSMGGAEPLQGTVELTWTASDADGDPLKFDVLYSRDGGATYQIAQASLTANSASLDTTALPGGSLIFRVRATDGVNTATADSAAMDVAMKSPRPIIM